MATHSETLSSPCPLEIPCFIPRLLHLRVAIPIGTAMSSKSGVGSQCLSLVLPGATNST